MRHLIAIGGAMLAAPEAPPLLENYVLKHARRASPRVAFLGAAGGESPDYVLRFFKSFSRLDCRPSHFSMFAPPPGDLSEYLLAQDVLIVGGGNTKSMLALWRDWGIDAILRAAWEAGVVLAGESAGSICWFEQGLTDSFTGRLVPLPCLGLIAGSNCPHFDSEIVRRPIYFDFVGAGAMLPGIASDDGVALHYEGADLVEVVTTRAEASAWRVERSGNEAKETRIEARAL
jgi:peptidase E